MELREGSSPGTILVAEDEPLVRMVVVEYLTEAGFHVLEAQSADQAIVILEERPDIRLVFSDVEMPGSMDGLKLCHCIRDRWPPVLLLVASGKAIVAENQLPPRARLFSKPYQHEKIVETIRGLLSLSS